MGSVISQNNFRFCGNTLEMVKLKSKIRLKRAFSCFESGRSTQKYLTYSLGISSRRFRQLYSIYKKTGDIAIKQKTLGRPAKEIPDTIRNLILDCYDEHPVNALYLEKYIYATKNIRVSHNKIHVILLQENKAKKEPNKSKRRKPWVRYERQHSLSAGHMDWTEFNGKQVCAIIDNASRKILTGAEFDNATTENSIKLLQEVIDKYAHLQIIREIITDHGAQFYANKRDDEGNANHTFELFCKQNNIKHILCRCKHPQSNGKIEKWFDFYKKKRNKFKSFEELVYFYNNKMHGSLRMRYAETPNQAFQNRLPTEVFFKSTLKTFKW